MEEKSCNFGMLMFTCLPHAIALAVLVSPVSARKSNHFNNVLRQAYRIPCGNQRAILSFV